MAARIPDDRQDILTSLIFFLVDQNVTEFVRYPAATYNPIKLINLNNIGKAQRSCAISSFILKYFKNSHNLEFV